MDPPSLPGKTKQKQARLKPEEYIQYKEPIRRLYLVENKSNKDVLEALKQRFDFEITNSQLIHLVNKVWHFRKQIKPADHKYIEYKKRKREEEGKFETRVKLCGITQDESNLDRRKVRRFVPTHEQHATAWQNRLMLSVQSPQQPVGLEVGTPTPRPISEISHATPASSPQHVATPLSYNMRNFYQGLPSLRLETVFNTLLTRLQGAPTPSPLSPSNTLPISRISDLLSATTISQNDLSMSRIVNSNVLLPEEVLKILQPLVIRFGNRAGDPRSLREALDNFTSSEIPHRFFTTLKSFFGNVTPIIDDFAVQTFYSAARTGNLSLLNLFIELGILESSRRSRWHSHARIIGATALQFSIEYIQGLATSLLLRNDIDVNAQPVSDLSQSLLKTAVEVQDLELVNQLLSLGAEDIVFNESYEHNHIRDGYLHKLKSAGLTWASLILNREFGSIMARSSSIGILTALHSAIRLPDQNIFETVLHNRITRKENGHPPIQFDSTSHIVAVLFSSDRLEAILKCDALHLEINGIFFTGSTALDIVYATKDQRSFRLLMEYGANRKLEAEVSSRGSISDPERAKRNFNGISLRQLYGVLDKLQSSVSSFPWTSYRQSLDSFDHLISTINLSLSSQVVSSNPAIEFVNCELDIFFSRQSPSRAFQSMETISGNFSCSTAYSEVYLKLGFKIYSKQKDTVNNIILADDSEVDTTSETDPEEWVELGDVSDPADREYLLEKLEARIFEDHKSNIWALRWARGADDDPTFHKQIIDLHSRLFSNITPSELSALLDLAVHSNLHGNIREIISYSPKLGKISVLEATWNGDNMTFDLILNFAQRTTGLGVPPELLTLIAIHIGHIYKVVRLLHQGVDANHVLESGTTFLETAAMLGRLDIAQALLNAGASYRLQEAKVKAEKCGHFIMSDIIHEQIKSLDPDVNMATPSDLSTPVAAANTLLSPANIPTPAPVIAESPRDPIVHEYDLYISSEGINDILSSSDPFGLSTNWPMQPE